MGFFRTIRDSIYSPKFYSEIPQKKFRSAFGYFFLLVFILTVFSSILPINEFINKGRPAIDDFVKKTINIYPKELELKIENGKVSSNVKEPYFITLPKEWTNNKNGNGNLVVIDTATPYSAEQFNEYKSLAWVTKDSIFYREENQIKTADLSKVNNMTINKAFVDKLFAKFSPWLKWITPIVSAAIILGIYMSYTSKLFYLLFLALLIMVTANLLKKPLSYKDSYKTGLYAMTLGFFVDFILGFTNIRGFAFMFTLIALVVVLLNKSKGEIPAKTPTQQPRPPVEIPKPKPLGDVEKLEIDLPHKTQS
jgi:hypothetical protein